MIKLLSAVVAVIITLTMVDTVNAFSIPPATRSSSSSRASLFSASQNSGDMTTTTTSTTSRTNFLKTAAETVIWTLLPAATTALPLPALAKDDAAAAALKGTKADPEYEACMSTCIYECTKPKGMEQKSRKECIPECKQTCATSKAQLMIGTPIKK